MKKLKGWIILLSVGFLMPFTIAEFGSRYILYKKTPSDLIFDKDLVFRCKPNGKIWNQSLNNIGCIGPNLRPNKSTNEVRIFLLGALHLFLKIM